MPAQDQISQSTANVFFHIGNEGVDQKTIFRDKEDYTSFTNFLGEYLSSPTDSEGLKKTFTIKGRVYQGVPHQPKNFIGRIQLIAYRLNPTSFHLVLSEKETSAIKEFMRALSTRYSIYFNKKYHRTGPVYAGSYKSIKIDKVTDLFYLTHHLHQHPIGEVLNIDEYYSSYPEYTQKRETTWVQPAVVLSQFDKSKDENFCAVNDYQHFVEKYQLTKEEKNRLDHLLFPTTSDRLERINLASPPIRVVSLQSKPEIGSSPNLPELFAATTLFLLLFSVGIRNVLAANKGILTPVASKETVLSASKSLLSPLEASQSADSTISDDFEAPKVILIIKADDPSARVSVYSSPSTDADEIAVAFIGDTLEYVNLAADWYEVKLADGRIGYVQNANLEITEIIH